MPPAAARLQRRAVRARWAVASPVRSGSADSPVECEPHAAGTGWQAEGAVGSASVWWHRPGAPAAAVQASCCGPMGRRPAVGWRIPRTVLGHTAVLLDLDLATS
jgi:hypothetical protein